MTLFEYPRHAARRAVLDARESVQRAERRCDTKALNRARRALIRATAWLLNEEPKGE
jgi:IS4 transposase